MMARSASYTLFNKTRRVDLTPGHVPATHVYQYDSAYRLTRAVVSAPPPLGTIRDTDYIEDGACNRLEVLNNGLPEPYVRNGVLCEPADLQMNQYSAIGSETRFYDLNGNLTTRLQGPPERALQFDVHNRLVVHSNRTTGINTTFTYDAIGRRIAKQVQGTGPAQTTQYLWGDDPAAHCNLWQVLEERDGAGALLRQYTYGGGLDDVVHMWAGGNDYFYHADDMGNVMVLTDAAGNPVERYEYGDYGEPQFFSAAGNQMSASLVGNPYLFSGRRYDPDTGLYYFRTRYLDPGAGRFISRDLLGIWGDAENSGNPYAYVGNNPWTHTDPMGMAKETFVRSKPHVNVGSKVKEVIREAGLRSDGELVQAVSDAPANPPITQADYVWMIDGASAGLGSGGTGVSHGLQQFAENIGTHSWSYDCWLCDQCGGTGSDPNCDDACNRCSIVAVTPGGAGNGPMPQTREHILLARQVGSTGASSSSDKRKQSLYFPETMLDDPSLPPFGLRGDLPAGPVAKSFRPLSDRVLVKPASGIKEGGMNTYVHVLPARHAMQGFFAEISGLGSEYGPARHHGHLDYLKQAGDPATSSGGTNGDTLQHEVGHWLGLYHSVSAPSALRKRPGRVKWHNITLKRGYLGPEQDRSLSWIVQRAW